MSNKYPISNAKLDILRWTFEINLILDICHLKLLKEYHVFTD